MLGFTLLTLYSKVTEHFIKCEENMQGELTEIAFKEIILRIIKFLGTFMLIINFQKLAKSFLSFKLLKVSPPSEN